MAVIELDRNSAGQTAAAVVGDEVVVTLDETPTSGYRWVLETIDQAVLSPLDDAFTPPAPGLLGGAGQHRFRFAVIGPGQTALRLGLRRPWDPAAIGDVFESTIDAALAAEGEPGP